METEPTLLSGRYELLREVRTGPIGSVWSGYDRELEQAVSLALPSDAGEEPAQRARLRRSVEQAALVRHPNVVTVHDAGDGSFVVMDAAPGRSLRQILDDHGPLPVDAAVDLAIGTCSALRAAHALRVSHGALSLDSLLVGPDGQVLVADFAVGAAVLGAKPARYAPPEQAAGRADDRSDLYALACCLYELLTGRPPVEHSVDAPARHPELGPRPPRSAQPDIPRSIEAVLHRALATDPTSRYQTPVELRRALQEARRERPDQVAASQIAALPLPDPPHRRSRGRHRPTGVAAPPDQRPADRTAGSARRAPLLLAVVLLGLLAGAVTVAVIINRDRAQDQAVRAEPTAPPATTPPPGGPAGAAVPALIGLTQSEAAAALGLAGLQLGEVRRLPDPKIPVDVVLSVSPPAGTVQPGGGPITLVVSAGAGPVSIADLITLVDADLVAAGPRAPTYRGRLDQVHTFTGDRRRAELADLLGIALAGASLGEFSPAFSASAVAVLAPQVGLRELIALIDSDPDATGPRGPKFGGRLAALDTLSGQPYLDEVAALLGIASAGAGNGDFTPQFSAAAVEVLRRLA